MKAKRALISVSNKEGLEELVKGLRKLKIEIISTGGTAKKIEELGFPVTKVEDVTGVKEFPRGLVKTLHPKIHFAILMDRENIVHLDRAKSEGIKPIDLVFCNLYPFQETAAKKSSSVDDLVDNIDIGGVSLIRAAAKNFKQVTIVTDPAEYGKVLVELLGKGETLLKTREFLAAKGFEHTADYDVAINSTMDEMLLKKKTLRLKYVNGQKLRYGENWHQTAEVYQNQGNTGIAGGKVLQGKEMSFNNYVDGNAALEAVKELNDFGVAIIKHTNPCGYATSQKNLADAFEKAWQGDPVSAFGSVIALNQEVDLETAQKTESRFVEILIAPKFSKEALFYLGKKKNLRLIEVELKSQEKIDLKCISGGLLKQNADTQLALTKFDELFKKASEVKGKTVGLVSETAPSVDKGLYEFAWKACKHVKSNAIIIARAHKNGFQLLGMGAGQPNRVDALKKLALTKARENLKLEFNELKPQASLEDFTHEELTKSVLASDAFFPFRDSIEVIAKAGIKNVIQPGGSLRDNEVIEACNESHIALVFTGMRHFKH